MNADAQRTLPHAIRRGRRATQDVDQMFVIVGLLIMIWRCLVHRVACFIDLVHDGAPRLGWDSSRNSRRARPSTQESCPPGSALADHVVTAWLAMPVGVAAAIYLEEYAPKNWFTGIIEINVTNLAGVPSIIYGLLALGLFVYQFGLGQSIPPPA